MAWSDDATRVLLTVWANERIQSQLEGQTRNKSVFESIATELAGLGYELTWQKCRIKIIKIIQLYRKTKDLN